MAWKFFTPDQGSGVPAVTALPSSPEDGDQIIFTDSLTAGTYHWHLRYVSARASNKWVYVGGSPAVNSVTASQNCSSSAYGDLSTTGPSITLPVAGDYLISISARCDDTDGSNVAIPFISYAIGATSAVDADAAMYYPGASASQQPYTFLHRTKKKTGLTAVAITMKYKTSGGAYTTTYAERELQITPIAIGG